MLKLALRNVFRQKVRTTMTLAAIVFGVVGLVLSSGFVEDIFIQLGEAVIHSQSGHLQVNQAGYFERGSRSPDRFIIEQPQALRKLLAKLPEVEDVMGRVGFSGLLNNGRSDLSIIGEGVEPDKEAKLGSFLVIREGRQLSNEDDFGIVIGYGVAKTLQLKPGAAVTVLVNTSDGALNSLDLEVIGVFQSFSKDFDSRAVRIPLKAAQKLLNTQGVNNLVVSLKKTDDTTRVQSVITRKLDAKQFEVKNWHELNDFFEKTVDLYQRQFGVLRLIILFMVLLSVANSVNISVFERIGEFGTMMSLGNRAGYVFGLIMLENTIVGLIGGATGVVVGLALAYAISAVGIPMPPPPNADLGYTAYIRVVPIELVLAFSIGLVATVGAALIPARRVTRIPVVEALRQNV